MRTALISVSDKTGIVEFATELKNLGFRLVSTGGTLKALENGGIEVMSISDLTGFPEILDGRVKTLHPMVHGGLLAMRENEEHMKTLAENEIDTIDLVCVNLYPFERTVADPDCSLEDAIENIDIGGPSMLRSAAKNYRSVYVLCDPKDYGEVVLKLKEEESGALSDLELQSYRLSLANKVFKRSSDYDNAINSYLDAELCKAKALGNTMPCAMNLNLNKVADLRYGENPAQSAAIYSTDSSIVGLASAKLLHGKPMSYNNYIDANAAVLCVREFESPAVVCLKHTTPCGVSESEDILTAYKNAYAADPVSVFGGIIAANRQIDAQTASEISKIFCEIVIAPSFSDEAFEILSAKKNLRLMRLDPYAIAPAREFRSVSGGILVQDEDSGLYDNISSVGVADPSAEEFADLIFALKVVKHAKSNAIVTAKNKTTLGVGTGQVSRVWATENAISHSFSSCEGAVLASDAFFPFADAVEKAAEAGVTAIIQPGGSVKDYEVIERAKELGLKMLICERRHFKH